MSATLSDTELLAKWLNNAKFYISMYRPVQVDEHIVFDNAIYSASAASNFYNTATQLKAQTQTEFQPQSKQPPLRTIQRSLNKELRNPLTNSVVSLANETVRAGYGALEFCSSRTGCERYAMLISRVLPRGDEINELIIEKRRDVLAELRSTATGLDSVLQKTIPFGVAFHHAGLTTEERDLIATAYDQGAIKVIVATCSLAAGINLPARRVILHGARMGADLVGPSMLRQMKGRAGRKGKDEIGETYLCCEKSDIEEVLELMDADLPPLGSCCLPHKRGIKWALLEVIATKLATSFESVELYIKKTLLYHLIEYKELLAMVSKALYDLEDTGLVKKDGTVLEATLLGQAVVTSSMGPEDGLSVHKELRQALEAFVLDGEMHVLYAFTPIQAGEGNINWQILRKEVESFDESDMRALNLIVANNS